MENITRIEESVNIDNITMDVEDVNKEVYTSEVQDDTLWIRKMKTQQYLHQ